MKLGTEDKQKTYAAIALTVVAVGTVYVQFFSGDPAVGGRPAPRPAATTQARSNPNAGIAPQTKSARTVQRRTTTTRRRSSGGDFEPIWRRSHEDEEFDPLADDPTLRTELLTKVRGVDFTGVDRNIFQFTTRKVATPPPAPAVVSEAQRRQEAFARQQETKPAAPPPAAPKRAPRLTWKYYGYASEAGVGERRAFLLNGEDVMIAGEGDLLQDGRYKVVRIGLSQIVIEDTQFSEEQSLSITAPAS